MPVRFLSDAELARLSGWPDEIAAEDLVTFFTLSPDDLAWLAGFNRDDNRLGAAVQLCALPWPGSPDNGLYLVHRARREAPDHDARTHHSYTLSGTSTAGLRRSPILDLTDRGSVGKTTTTAHLGTVPTKPVLAVDLDPAGDAGAWNRGAEQSGEYETVLLDLPPGDG